MQTQNDQQQNNLFLLRTAQGLELKQIARMLDQKSTAQVSGYEKGESPSLKNFLKLLLIFDATPREMYPDFVEACRTEIEATIRQRSFVIRYTDRLKVLENISSCTFEDRLNNGGSEDDKRLAKAHVVNLMAKTN